MTDYEAKIAHDMQSSFRMGPPESIVTPRVLVTRVFPLSYPKTSCGFLGELPKGDGTGA